MTRQHDWESLEAELSQLIQDADELTMTGMAKTLGIPGATLRGHLRDEYGLHADGLAQFPQLYEKRLLEANDELPDGAQFVVEGNRAQAWGGAAERIKTLEDLIEYHKINLEKWAIERHIANAWEVHAKVNGKVTPFTNHQVKAWFVSKEPEAVKPVIHPVEVTATYKKPPKPPKGKTIKSLGIADLQAGFAKNTMTNTLTPFHDRRVLDLALQLLAHEEFDEIVLLGDEMDMAEWSTRWTVEPEFYFTTQATIIELNWWLQQIRQAAPKAKMVMLQGNHDRFKDAIVAHMKAAYELRPADELHRDAVLSMPRLLALDKLQIEFIDGYQRGAARYSTSSSLEWTHADIARNAPGATAGGMVGKNYRSVIHAHVHRIEMASKTMLFGDERAEIVAVSCGCACHVDGRVPGSKVDSNWQQGLVVTSVPEDGPADIHPVHIVDGKMTYGGELFVARERDEEAEAVIREGMREIEAV